MIRVDRATLPRPAALDMPYDRGAWKGKTEAERVATLYRRHLEAGGEPRKFKFEYSRYKQPEVKATLEALFHGKCAYCESRYVGTQPIDVEHWRPKGEVHALAPDGSKSVLPGYHWLASDWDNLFPSCIDCNRGREQTDFLTGEKVLLGKASQFPVEGPRMGPPAPGATPAFDTPLLVNPCEDDPAEHLELRSDGGVVAVNDSPKGEQSIRVYALNRTELAMDRLGLVKLIEQRLFIIEGLARVLQAPNLPQDLRIDIEDLLSHEIDTLLTMAEPDRPFSALARTLIDDASPL